MRAEYDAALEEARASGDRGKVKLAWYQSAWARRVEAQLRDGTAPTEVPGPVHAVRIGDGVIVTGPGETFTEYGIAVKERSPGLPTLYAGYTNEILGYLPTANEYQYGGYEAGYGYKSVGLPSLFDPSLEQTFVETGVRLAEQLFPEVEPYDGSGRLARAWGGADAATRATRAPVAHARRGRVVSRARIGVIGAGFWASYQYLPFFRDHPDVELVGAVRKDEQGLDAFREEFGLEVATSSVAELLAAGVDGVVVSSPHTLHREHAVAALEAGAHVLVEKPMTVTLADARALAAASVAAERTVGVAHGWNYQRLTTWAKDLLLEERLGAVTSVTGYMSSCLTDLFSGRSGYGVLDVGGFPVEAETATWAKADAGGGYLYGQLCHLLALGLWLVPNEPEDVFARAHLLENGVDLDIQVSVALEGGVIGSFSGQGHEPWGQPPRVRSPDRRREGRADARLRPHAGAAPARGRQGEGGVAHDRAGSARRRARRRVHLRRRRAVPRRHVPRARDRQSCAARPRRAHGRRDGRGLAVGAHGRARARRGSVVRMTETICTLVMPGLVFGSGASLRGRAAGARASASRAPCSSPTPSSPSRACTSRSRAACREAGVDVVLHLIPVGEPTESTLEHAGTAAREAGVDGVIGLGGGSALDAAKVAALLGAHGGRVRDYVNAPLGGALAAAGPAAAAARDPDDRRNRLGGDRRGGTRPARREGQDRHRAPAPAPARRPLRSRPDARGAACGDGGDGHRRPPPRCRGVHVDPVHAARRTDDARRAAELPGRPPARRRLGAACDRARRRASSSARSPTAPTATRAPG